MRAIILAAGYGTRLKPITNSMPKPMVPLLNKPLIQYTVELLAKHKIKNIVINLHYLMDDIETYLGDGKQYGVKITYSKEKDILGTAGGIKKCEKFLSKGPFIVINSDIMVNIDLTDLLKKHSDSGAMATMVLKSHPESKRFGEFGVDENNFIVNFLGKGKEVKSKYMFTGIHVLEPEFFDYIEGIKFSSVIDEFYRKVFNEGKIINGYLFEDFWNDLGTLYSFHETSMFLLKKRYLNIGKTALFVPKEEHYLGENVEINHPVAFGNNVKVLANSVVGPNVILGDNSIVYTPEGIKDSIILSDVQYDSKEKIENTIICKDGVEKVF